MQISKDAKETKIVHGCSAGTDHDREVPEIDLLSPLKIRGLLFRNRIAMSPMCQYSAIDGMANDWHFTHLTSRAVGGVSLVMAEATAVAKEGRISPKDLGLWNDGHLEPLKAITQFIHKQGAIAGIQLAHAGRKGSCDVPWKGGGRLLGSEGWQVIAPSSIPFNSDDPLPLALDEKGINGIIDAFVAAAKRALAAGFKVIEIHAAHGYLLHEFLSPISNQRNDQYGGSLENRMRLLLQVAACVRKEMAEELPLFVRISATDWVAEGWDENQSVILAEHLKKIGVDLIDVSSGGMVPKAQIPVAKGYQVPFARRIRDEAHVMTATVGLITEAQHANEIITGGDADMVFLGRELLREPYWAIKAEHELNSDPQWPIPYGYAVKRRAK